MAPGVMTSAGANHFLICGSLYRRYFEVTVSVTLVVAVKRLLPVPVIPEIVTV